MNRLKELRKENNKTQQEIAELLGVSKRTVINWESQEELKLKSDKAQVLANYFGVSVAYLLGYQDDFLISDGNGGAVSMSSDYNASLLEQYSEHVRLELVKFLSQHGFVISDNQISTLLKVIDSYNINNVKSPWFEKALEQSNPKEFLNKKGYIELSEFFQSHPFEEWKKRQGLDTNRIL